jgi:protease I
MADELKGQDIAFLMANEGVEQVELTEPWRAVTEAGGRPVLVAPKAGKVQAFNHLDKAEQFPVDQTVAEADPNGFAGLVLPGGVANPDQLRMKPDAVAFVQAFFDTGRPVAAICHAPWMLVEADRVRGRNVTSWPSLQTDLRNAGANWADQQVLTCTDGPNVLVTSRKPADLPAFTREVVSVMQKAKVP